MGVPAYVKVALCARRPSSLFLSLSLARTPLPGHLSMSRRERRSHGNTPGALFLAPREREKGKLPFALSLSLSLVRAT